MKVLTDLTVRCPSCKTGTGRVKDDLILADPSGEFIELLFICPKETCKTEVRLKYKLTETIIDRTNSIDFRIEIKDSND